MCCSLVVFCLFFFFKQKTAYEMRISDWSSDVCSSDLLLLLALGLLFGLGLLALRRDQNRDAATGLLDRSLGGRRGAADRDGDLGLQLAGAQQADAVGLARAQAGLGQRRLVDRLGRVKLALLDHRLQAPAIAR